MAELLDRFMRVYAGLHPSEKNQVCVTVDGRPFTWNVIYFELRNNTPFGNQAAQQMAAMNMI